MEDQNLNSDTEMSFEDQLEQIGENARKYIESMVNAAGGLINLLSHKLVKREDQELFNLPVITHTFRFTETVASYVVTLKAVSDDLQAIVYRDGSYHQTDFEKATIDDLCDIADYLTNMEHEKDTAATRE